MSRRTAEKSIVDICPLCINVHMSCKIRSHNQILALWKSLTLCKGEDYMEIMAGDLRLERSTIRGWRTRGSIPAKYWPELIRAVDQRFGVAVTADELMLAAAGHTAYPDDAKTEPDTAEAA